MVESEECEIVDLRFCDLPGVMQHVSIPASVARRGRVRGRPRLRRLVDPRLPGDPGVRHDPRSPIPTPRYVDPFRQHKTLVIHCFVADPVTGESYSPRPALRRPEGRGAPPLHRHRRHRATSVPSPSSSSSTTCASSTTPTRRSTRSTRSRASWNTGADEGPNLGYKPRTKEGYFPVPPMDHYQDLRSEMTLDLHDVGIETELHHHEVASGGQGEIGIRFDTLLRHGRQAHDVQVRPQERGLGGRQDGSRSCRSRSSRTTARACTRTSRCGRAASRCSTTRPATPACPTWPAGTSAACSTTPTRSSPSPTRRPTASSGWCRATRRRSTSCTASATARRRAASRWPRRARRPSGVEFRCPDSYVATRTSPSRRCCMAGLDGIQNRIEPPDAGRQGPLRPPARGAGQGARRCRLARGGARRARGRPGLPEGRRRLHRRPHRDLDHLQAHATRSTPSASAPTPTSSRSTTTSDGKSVRGPIGPRAGQIPFGST